MYECVDEAGYDLHVPHHRHTHIDTRAHHSLSFFPSFLSTLTRVVEWISIMYTPVACEDITHAHINSSGLCECVQIFTNIFFIFLFDQNMKTVKGRRTVTLYICACKYI